MEHKRKSTIIRKKQIIDAARKIIIRKGSEHLTLEPWPGRSASQKQLFIDISRISKKCCLF